MYIQQLVPNLSTLERSLKKRGPKIYLDYLQNRRGQTIVSAYSLRPKPHATVSTPLQWREVKSGLKPEDFTIKNVPERVATLNDIFKGVLKEGIDMEAALDNLANKQ
jgi:bifunctional non-homologous end joining protein LigD